MLVCIEKDRNKMVKQRQLKYNEERMLRKFDNNRTYKKWKDPREIASKLTKQRV